MTMLFIIHAFLLPDLLFHFSLLGSEEEKKSRISGKLL